MKRATRKKFTDPANNNPYTTMGTSLGGNFTKVAQTQVTPASGIGYVAPGDDQFNQTNGDIGPAVAWQQTKYEPLWNTQAFVYADHKLQHDTRFATPHSRFEEIQLYRPAFTQSSRANDQMLPQGRPQAQQPIVRSNQGMLRGK